MNHQLVSPPSGRLAIRKRSRASGRSLLGALLFVCAACGAEATESAPAPSAASADEAGGSRSERLARTAATLAEHRRVVERQGLATPLLDTCQKLLEKVKGVSYDIRANYGISIRDTWFLLAWNRGSARPGRSTEQEAESLRKGLEGLVELSRKLRERGTELVVVPIPRMHQIYPERVVDGLEVPEGFVGVDPATAKYLADLTEAGVEVVHLTPAYAAQRVSTAEDQDRFLFHDYNNHWTARAVNLTAEVIAEKVVQLEDFEPGTLRGGVDWQLERQKIIFKVPPPRGSNMPEVKVETEVWIDAILNANGKPAQRPDRMSPILILGDSNAQWYTQYGAAVPDQIGARLGQRLDLIAIPGVQADGVWKNLERRKKSGTTLADKRIIIWIFELDMLLDEELADLAAFVE